MAILRRACSAAPCGIWVTFYSGAFLGLVPAAFLVAATSAARIALKIPLTIVLGSGALFCILGILTRGRFLARLLHVSGKDIDRGYWP